MADQPRFGTFQANDFFADGSAARPIPAHTIAQGDFRKDTLERGRERYDIYYGVCHVTTGDGRRMIVLRGFPPPPSLHLPRLREVAVGHFYEVITKGHGVMYSYASRVEPADRWAIAAYLRGLQQRENTPLAALTADERAKLEALEK